LLGIKSLADPAVQRTVISRFALFDSDSKSDSEKFYRRDSDAVHQRRTNDHQLFGIFQNFFLSEKKMDRFASKTDF
jgi:hypothetical protein